MVIVAAEDGYFVVAYSGLDGRSGDNEWNGKIEIL